MDSQRDEVVPASKNGIKSEIYRTVPIIRGILKIFVIKFLFTFWVAEGFWKSKMAKRAEFQLKFHKAVHLLLN